MSTPSAALPRAVAGRGGPPRAVQLVSRHAVDTDPLCELREMRSQYARLGAFVNGARLLDEVLLIVAPIIARPEPSFCLSDASKHTGYSAAHLRRLIRDGAIPNRGKERAPRVFLSDCPHRPARISRKVGA